MRTFGMDLRVRVRAARQGGDTTAEVADRFGVSAALGRRLMQRFAATGALAAGPGGRGPAHKLAARASDLRAAVAAHPDRTPAEHREHLARPASVSTVARTPGRLGLTREKSRPGRPAGPPGRRRPAAGVAGGGGRGAAGGPGVPG